MVRQLINEGKYQKAIDEFIRIGQYENAVCLALKINNKSLAIDICLDYRDFDFIKYIQKFH